MTTPPTLEERVTTVEDTVKQLITSLRPPETALKKIERDIQSLTRTTAVAHQCILDMVTESAEVQKLQEQTIRTVNKQGRQLGALRITVDKHSEELAQIKTTVARHSDELIEIKSTLSDHSRELTEIKSTINEHGRELTEIKSTINEHGRELTEIKSTLNEHGAMLRQLGTTLNVVVTKLDAR